MTSLAYSDILIRSRGKGEKEFLFPIVIHLQQVRLVNRMEMRIQDLLCLEEASEWENIIMEIDSRLKRSGTQTRAF